MSENRATTETQILSALHKIPGLMPQFARLLKLRRLRHAKQVLLVEDQLLSRRLMQEFLSKFTAVSEAVNVKGGLEHYLRHAPDIVFLDIDLPDDTGHMLARIIKSIDPDAYVVMVTGNHTASDVAAARHNNIDGYIVKPFNKQKIMNSLVKYLALHPTFAIEASA